MHRRLHQGWTVVLGLAMLWLTGCQSPPRFQPAMDDDPIKPGDVLLVYSSASTEQFAAKWIVDDAGNLPLPYSGPWRVAGKKPSELEKRLSQYFSVGRAVTFKVEKMSPELFESGEREPPAGPRAKKPALTSPKAAGNTESLEPPPKPPHPDAAAG